MQRSSAHPDSDKVRVRLEKLWSGSKTDPGELVIWRGRMRMNRKVRGRVVQLHERGGQAFSHTEV